MAALQKEIRVLESGLYSPYNPVTDTSPTAAFQVSTKDSKDDSTICGNTGKKKGPVCVFCKGPHPTHTCESVTDHQKRLEIIKRENLCFNCLAHHKISQCQSRFRCKKCKKKHHTTLCNSETQHSGPTHDKTADKPPAPNFQQMLKGFLHQYLLLQHHSQQLLAYLKLQLLLLSLKTTRQRKIFFLMKELNTR